MKHKFGMLIEKDLLRLARQRAAEEGRPLSDLIQDALAVYLNTSATTARERSLAFQLFCERPMQIPADKLRNVLGDDMWNT
jgi:hypothetical protein